MERIKIPGGGGRLKAAREAAGLSQRQLAEQANISIRTLQMYEQELRDIGGARLTTMLKICCALACAIPELLDDSEAAAFWRRYEEMRRKP
jgi:transcriptional regulator with XRE-family HTH domain